MIRLGLLFALVAATTVSLPARPATAIAGSLLVDPSPRSAGMGGASTAVHWSGDGNGWANPALLGYVSGLRYRWSNSRLLPGIARDVTFHTDHFSYGWGGVGLAVERQVLSYGQIQMTDAQGTPIGYYEPTENARPLRGGISVSRAIEAVALLRGVAAPGLIRYGDVAVGFSRKPVRGRLAPASYGPEYRTVASDFGLLVRATPLPRTDTGRPNLDLTYGFAALNKNDAAVYFIDEDRADYVPRQYRHGVAARIDFPLSQGRAAGLERRFGRRIASGMDPLVSVAVAADFSRNQWGPHVPYGTGVDQIGVELGIANALAIRFGHVGDEFRGIDAYSFGAGLGLSLADFAGARYDYARYPVGGGLGMLDRHAVETWFDPVAFARRRR